MSQKYKGMTYTIRKDGRLTKKVTIKGKINWLYSSEPSDLYRQYIELKHNSYQGINISNNNIKLKDFALKWLKLNSVGKAYGTIKEYNFLINSFIIPNLGYFKLTDIKKINVEQMLESMKEILPTAKKALQLTKRILNEAVDNDLIIKNVAKNIKAPKYIKEEKRPLSLYEDRLLLNSQSKYADFFILIRYTGIRKEEVVPLSIDDIDLENRKIIINKAVTFIHNHPVIKETKNSKTREVPILNIVYPIIKKLIDEANAHNRKLLFVKEIDKKMLTDSAIKRHLESFLYVTNKDIKEDKKRLSFTCHQLRHSFCTMLYYADVKLKKAQQILGHSSAKMVYDIYAHLDEQRENANSLINEYIQKVVV